MNEFREQITREEWLEASKRTSEAIYAGASDAAITEAALGPCPPKPAPKPFCKGEYTLVRTNLGAIQIHGFQLTPDEADQMAESLTEHAWYIREQAKEDAKR